jgi:hypothetical protein
MKCLTYEESQKWLDLIGISIGTKRELVFPGEQQKIMMTVPKTAPALNWFSARLGRWLSRGSERMLWMSNWDTFPHYPIGFFEAIRNGYGETRPVIEAPGHVFSALNRAETELVSGLIFLVMTFRWEAFIVSQESTEFVYLGDQCVVCSSPKSEKMKRVTDFMAFFEIRAIQDIREAWN